MAQRLLLRWPEARRDSGRDSTRATRTAKTGFGYRVERDDALIRTATDRSAMDRYVRSDRRTHRPQ